MRENSIASQIERSEVQDLNLVRISFRNCAERINEKYYTHHMYILYAYLRNKHHYITLSLNHVCDWLARIRKIFEIYNKYIYAKANQQDNEVYMSKGNTTEQWEEVCFIATGRYDSAPNMRMAIQMDG